MKCIIEGCDKDIYAKQMCQSHYRKNARDNNTKTCSVEGCTAKITCKGLCSKHYYESLERPGTECAFDGCSRGVYGNSIYCSSHSFNAYTQEKKSTPKRRFGITKKNAKQRRIEFDLTLEQYENVVKDATCYYCGNTLPEWGGGLDRRNNNFGYTLENVVPCCATCNAVKNSTFTEDEMLVIGQLLRAIREKQPFSYVP